MNTLFENKYKCTEEVYKDIYQYVYFHNKITYGILIFYVFLLGLTNYVSLTTGNGLNYKSLLAIVLILFFLVFYSRIAGKRRYKSDLNSNKWIPVITTFMVREDAIVVKHSNNSANPIAYSEFKKVANTKKFFIFITKDRLALYFKKDSFTKGTAEEFEAFIKEKGFQI